MIVKIFPWPAKEPGGYEHEYSLIIALQCSVKQIQASYLSVRGNVANLLSRVKYQV